MPKPTPTFCLQTSSSPNFETKNMCFWGLLVSIPLIHPEQTKELNFAQTWGDQRDYFTGLRIGQYMERYEIVKDIGSGNFGVAKLVRDKWTKEHFAVKFIERGHKVCFFFNLSFPLSSFESLVSVEICNFWCCRLTSMYRGRSWTTDHWSIQILLDSKRLVIPVDVISKNCAVSLFIGLAFPFSSLVFPAKQYNSAESGVLFLFSTLLLILTAFSCPYQLWNTLQSIFLSIDVLM